MAYVFIRIEGWCRSVVDPSDNGVEVQIHLAQNPKVSSYCLSGVIALDHEMSPSGVQIEENALALPEQFADELLRAGYATVWNALITDNAAAAGTRWLFMADWLSDHGRLEDRIQFERDLDGLFLLAPQRIR